MTANPQEFFGKYREGMRAVKEEFPSPLKGFNHFYGKAMNEGTLRLKAKERRALAVSLEATSVGAARGRPAFTFLPLVHKTLDSLKKK